MKNQHLSNIRGFTLPEVMIALGIMAIVTMATLSIMDNARKNAAITEGQKQRTVIRDALATHLMFVDTCASAFGVPVGSAPAAQAGTVTIDILEAQTAAGTPITLTIPDFGFGSVALAAGEILKGRHITIEGVFLYGLSDPAPAPIAASVAPNDLRKAFIRVNMSATVGETKMGLRSPPAGMIYLLMDAGGTIHGCYAPVNRTQKEICIALGGDYDEARTPTCRFRAREVTCPGPTDPPNAHLWTGILSDGTPICRSLTGCPAGSFMTGINGAGPAVTCHDPEFVDAL